MKILHSILLFFASVTGFAQEPSKEHERVKRLSAYIAPLGTIDIITIPRLIIGAECQLSKKFSLAVDGGLFLPRFNQYSNVKGFQVKTELKYFFMRAGPGLCSRCGKRRSC